MALNRIEHSGTWHVIGRIDEVYDVLIDGAEYARWWPSVFRKVIEVQPGDAYGLDRVDVLETRGRLPGLLHWHTSVEEADRPASILFHAWGDLEGSIEWRLRQDDAWAEVSYELRLEIKQSVLRRIAPMSQALLASELRWALDRGQESLRLEMARRQALDGSERAALPQPPPPVNVPIVPIVAGIGLLTAVYLWRATSSRPPAARSRPQR